MIRWVYKSYASLYCDDKSDFEEVISNELNDGWVLFGDPKIYFNTDGSVRNIVQTMIKKIEM